MGSAVGEMGKIVSRNFQTVFLQELHKHHNTSVTFCIMERQSLCAICLLLISIFYLNVFVSSFLITTQSQRATFTSSNYHTGLYTTTHNDDEIISIINSADVGKRFLSITTTDFPVVGELFESGKFQLCIINGLKSPNSISSGKSQCSIKVAPLLNVLLIDESSNYQLDSVIEEKSMTVDLGQVTTVWKFPIQKISLKDYATFLSRQLANAIVTLQQEFPVNTGEQIMKSLYETRINRCGSSTLSKKDLQKLSSGASSQNREHIDQVLRKAIKSGHCKTNSKLIDSLITAKEIFQHSKDDHQMTTKLLSGAKLLAIDAEQGGRFKRSPCIFISATFAPDQNGIPVPSHLNLLNGGWVAVDESVKAFTEAKKFAQHSAENGSETKRKVFTAADERIMYRLECFALGEEFQNQGDLKDLELDVRETLRSMDLPLTAEGAQQALVKVGLWSSARHSENSSRFSYSPFPCEVLDCAVALQKYEKKRRQDLYKKVQQKRVQSSQKEDRLDLTQLPTLCIDAKRASFRDDAIGVRLRSSTGRKVIRGSKWEILIHIADVSDLYVTQSSIPMLDLTLLRKTAENRGSSRYDLPLGPLHLMPPVALEALSLDVKQKDGVIDSVNRCVSIWVYIDENTGKIIDSGIERTLIQQPIALSFQEASELLGNSDDSISSRAKQIKMLLTVIENSVTKWKATQLRSNTAAQQREERLNVKEMVAKETIGIDSSRDDGAKGSFQRTRGHKLVDYTLDLHGVVLSFMMKKANAPIPRVSGGGEERGGRVGSAPLRRYIDGVTQRQALSVLCNYGGPPLTKSECLAMSKIATQAINRITNNRAYQPSLINTSNLDNSSANRKKALRRLESHFSLLDVGRDRIVPALTTGVNNQVVISGIGLRVTCKGVNGTLKSGERVRVNVTKLDSKTGAIEVKLASNI